MENLKKIVKSILFLIMIFIVIGWILSFKINVETSLKSDLKEELVLIEIENENQPSNNVIVNENFVKSINPDANMVLISSSGQAYVVNSDKSLTKNEGTYVVSLEGIKPIVS